MWRRIRASGGRVAVGELAEAVGWTRRYLTRKFTQQATGDLALRAGYSDHPHLVREMRALTGSTPSQVLRYLSSVSRDADQFGMSHSFKTPPAPANYGHSGSMYAAGQR